MTKDDLHEATKRVRAIHGELSDHYRKNKPTPGIADAVRAALLSVLLLENILHNAAESLDVEQAGPMAKDS